MMWMAMMAAWCIADVHYATAQACAGDCDFEASGVCGYTQDPSDDADWLRHSGPTSTTRTGPGADHTYQNRSGHYMYFEASMGQISDVASLESPVFTISADAVLSFYYHMMGHDLGSLQVFLFSNYQTPKAQSSLIFEKSGFQSQEWIHANVTIPKSTAGAEPLNIVFKASRGKGFSGDIAIDDITLNTQAVTTTTTSAATATATTQSNGTFSITTTHQAMSTPSTPAPDKTTNVPIQVTNDVMISSSPSSVHENFTKSLTVNCSFSHGPDSDLDTLVSLVLSVTASVTSVVTEVATITAFSHDMVQVKDSLGAKVVGYLHADGESYISLQWVYPGDQVLGKYSCTGFGLDSSGHPRTSAADTTVDRRSLDCDVDVLPKFKDTDVKFDALKVKVDTSRKSFFKASTSHMNHTYHVSGPIPRDIQMAADLCVMYGGHLAELDTREEFEAVVNFTEGVVNGGDWGVVALGSTDKGHEGQWELMTSDANMTFFAWRDQEPTMKQGEDCLFLTGSPKMAMDDGACEGPSFIRVLCEMGE